MGRKRLVVLLWAVFGFNAFCGTPLELSADLVQRVLKLEDLELRLRAKLHSLLAERGTAKRVVVQSVSQLEDAFHGELDATAQTFVIELLKSKDVNERRLGVALSQTRQPVPLPVARALLNLVITDRSLARQEALEGQLDIGKEAHDAAAISFARERLVDPKEGPKLKAFSRRLLSVSDPETLAKADLRDFLAFKEKEGTEAPFPSAETIEKLGSEDRAVLKKRLMEMKSPKALESLATGFGSDADVKKHLLEHFDAIFSDGRRWTGTLGAAVKNDSAFSKLVRQKWLSLFREKGELPEIKLAPILGDDFKKELAGLLAGELKKEKFTENYPVKRLEDLLFWALPASDPGLNDSVLAILKKHLDEGKETEEIFNQTLYRAYLGGPKFLEAYAGLYLTYADCSDRHALPGFFSDSKKIPPCWYESSTASVVEAMKQTLEKNEPLRRRWQSCYKKLAAKPKSSACSIFLFGKATGLLSREIKKDLLAKRAELEPFEREKIETSLLPLLGEEDLPEVQAELLAHAGKSKEELVQEVELLEKRRDLYGPELTKHFDREIAAAQDKARIPKTDPCDMVCGTRKSAAQWTAREFKGLENGANLSEQDYSVANLVAAFDLQTRKLCPVNEAGDKALKRFHFPPLPFSVGYLGQREKARKRNLKAGADELDGVHAAGEAGRALVPSIAPVLTTVEQKVRESTLRKHDESTWSMPGVLTNSLVYGVATAEMFLNSGPDLKDAPPGWVDRVKAAKAEYTKSYDHEKGHGGSVYGNYALGLMLNADAKPDPKLIETLEKVALPRLGKCDFPYTRSVESTARLANESDVYRSVVIWKGLAEKGSEANRPAFQKSLELCLKKYFEEPWGAIHSRKGKGERHHTESKREFAPYYYYGTLFVAARAAVDSKDKALTAKLLRRLQMEWNSEKGLFLDSAARLYPARPTYYNPLMAMAALPLCQASKL